MTETEAKPFLLREELIAHLERVVFALAEAMKRPGIDPAKGRAALVTAMSCRCVRCGAVVEGKYLIELARLPANSEPDGIKRLRKGICAREGCNSDTYEFILHKHPELDWPVLLAPPESESRALEEEEQTAAAAFERKIELWRMIRVALVIASVLLLILLRQYYRGGTIPLVRTPEKFRVDPWPP